MGFSINEHLHHESPTMFNAVQGEAHKPFTESPRRYIIATERRKHNN
jgi:hypothetical protein